MMTRLIGRRYNWEWTSGITMGFQCLETLLSRASYSKRTDSIPDDAQRAQRICYRTNPRTGCRMGRGANVVSWNNNRFRIVHIGIFVFTKYCISFYFRGLKKFRYSNCILFSILFDVFCILFIDFIFSLVSLTLLRDIVIIKYVSIFLLLMSIKNFIILSILKFPQKSGFTEYIHKLDNWLRLG